MASPGRLTTTRVSSSTLVVFSLVNPGSDGGAMAPPKMFLFVLCSIFGICNTQPTIAYPVHCRIAFWGIDISTRHEVDSLVWFPF